MANRCGESKTPHQAPTVDLEAVGLWLWPRRKHHAHSPKRHPTVVRESLDTAFLGKNRKSNDTLTKSSIQEKASFETEPRILHHRD